MKSHPLGRGAVRRPRHGPRAQRPRAGAGGALLRGLVAARASTRGACSSARSPAPSRSPTSTTAARSRPSGCKSFHDHKLPVAEPARWTQQVTDGRAVEEDLDLECEVVVVGTGAGGGGVRVRARVARARGAPARGGRSAPPRRVHRPHAADGEEALPRPGDDDRPRQRRHPGLRGTRAWAGRRSSTAARATARPSASSAAGARSDGLAAFSRQTMDPVLRARRGDAPRRARAASSSPAASGGSSRAAPRRWACATAPSSATRRTATGRACAASAARRARSGRPT